MRWSPHFEERRHQCAADLCHEPQGCGERRLYRATMFDEAQPGCRSSTRRLSPYPRAAHGRYALHALRLPGAAGGVRRDRARRPGARARKGSAPRDLAMNVVLPELDGRIMTRAVSFKADDHWHERTQCRIVDLRAGPGSHRFRRRHWRPTGSRCGATPAGRTTRRHHSRELSEQGWPHRQWRGLRHAGQHGRHPACAEGAGYEIGDIPQ